MMLKRIFTGLVMIIMLAVGSVAMAADVQRSLAVVDEVINSGDVLYTIYKGMPIRDLRENFKGAIQWTIKDGEEILNGNPNRHARNYYVYRNIGDEKEPVYELLWITSDDTDENVWSCNVNFFTDSEKVARAVFNKAVNEYKIKDGTPVSHRGKYRTGKANRKREMIVWDSMESYAWSKNKVHAVGWEHMYGQATEFVAEDFCLPQAISYRVCIN